jgi:hypothetical protein
VAGFDNGGIVGGFGMFIGSQGGREEDVTPEELFAKFDGEWSMG